MSKTPNNVSSLDVSLMVIAKGLYWCCFLIKDRMASFLLCLVLIVVAFVFVSLASHVIFENKSLEFAEMVAMLSRKSALFWSDGKVL